MFIPRPHQRRDPDTGIRQTDRDASQARLSAVRKGYLKDPFITFFVPQPHSVPSRPPLINIGTYVRSEGLDELIMNWLNKASADEKKVQIISLGAGSDTRFWRIASGCLGKDASKVLARYLELDFPENNSAKIRAIQSNKELSSSLESMVVSDFSLTSSVYTIRSADLRNFQTVFQDLIAPPASADGQPSRCILDCSLPTLVLAECVLVYMKQEYSDALIKWFSDTFTEISFIVYEMYGLNDSFGKVMKENLKLRNVALPGVDAYPTLECQRRRFTNNGFEVANALSLKTIRQRHIPPAEITRIAGIEFLDELEELELVLDHYFISWASKGEFPKGWNLKRKDKVPG